MDIDAYAAKMYPKWRMQGGIDAEWDDCAKKLQDTGFDNILLAYQKAYDRRSMK